MTTADLIPRMLLLGDPGRASPRLSPDGSMISFIAPTDGRNGFWIAPPDAVDQAKRLDCDAVHGIRAHGWVGTGTHLWYLQDQAGNENHHLYTVDVQTGTVRDLTPCDQVQARIIGFSRKHPRHALIGLNLRDRRWHDVFRIDMVTGDRELIYENPGFSQFLSDEDLGLSLALRNTADGGRDVLLPSGDPLSWTEWFHIDMEDVLSTQPLSTGPSDSRIVYFLDSRDRETTAAVAIHTDTGLVEVLGEDPDTDILQLDLDPVTRCPEGYRTDYLKPDWHAIGTAAADDYRTLMACGYADFSIVDRNRDNTLWIVSLSGGDTPVEYVLYRRDARRIQPLFSSRPELKGRPLAGQRSVLIPSRDGLELVSYLSLPAGTPRDEHGLPASPLPMVLLVHGGPWSRDHYRYNPEHQFLANRGYAILSVNYRGSTGFGKRFVNAGNLEWGGRMQEDLLDAVEWAIRHNVADRNRIAIMGGSYGGYASLVGLSFTPDVFACGIDIVGPSNLETLLASFPAYWAPLFENFARRTGDPRTGEGKRLLHDRSPLHRAGNITRPLLIAQGANDVRVTRAESDQLVEAMQRNGKTAIYLLYPDEGHGFARAENRLSFMAVAEAFLSRFLGGACEPVGDAVAGSSVQILAGADQIESLPGREVLPSRPTGAAE